MFPFSKIGTSVRIPRHTSVTSMQYVITLMDPTIALVRRDITETDEPVQVISTFLLTPLLALSGAGLISENRSWISRQFLENGRIIIKNHWKVFNESRKINMNTMHLLTRKNGNMPVLGHANPNTKITNSQKLITRSKPAQNQFPHLPYF